MELPPGYTHIPLTRVNSTQDEAARYLAEGGIAGRTVFTAKEQVQGRGRGARQWSSPEGNLYATLVLFPQRPQSDWAQVSFVISLVLAEAIEKLLPRVQRVELKWPNDVLVKGRKISGILLETRDVPNGGEALLLGFGVNCRAHPADALFPATDLADEGAKAEDIAPENLLSSILQAFEPLYRNWEAEGLKHIRPAWLQRARKIGEWISISVSDWDEASLEGRFAGMDEVTGALILEDKDGKKRPISCGDVFFPEKKRA